MLRQVERYMRENAMTEPGDTLVVGVSGGADSVCLVHVLKRLSDRLGIKITACHVMHGIRGEEAERDAAFVADLCEKLDVPLDSYRRDVPAYAARMNMTVEEAGRYVRRQIFSEVMKNKGARKIALAHHEDDLAETVLMNCSRGTGIGGLAALRPVRGPYIRPLLCVSRSDIEAWLGSEGIRYCTDSTNADTAYTRNAVRNIILPQMEEHVNRAAKRHLAELSREARELTDFLDRECAGRKELYVSSDGEGFFISDLCAVRESRFIASRIVRSVLSELAGTQKDITRRHVEDVLCLMGKESGRQLDLPYKMWAERRAGGILLCVRKEQENTVLREEILTVPGVYEVEDGVLSVEICANDGFPIPRNMYTKAFDYDKIKGILTIRTRLPGDFIVINTDGRRKSFSDYLTDSKVDRRLRDRIPLVACGQEILWAVGYRSGESMRIGADTKRILVMTFRKKSSEE